jgi:2-methylcitrate dehydratase PrpD
MASISTQLAGFYKRLAYADIPKEKIADLRWLVLDYLGVASMGSSTQSGRVAIQHALNQGSHPVATLIGSQRKAVPLLAAFANAISAHSIELDDVDDVALYHFSPGIVSAALAMAEKTDSSGRAFLTAVYAGCEMMARLSNALNPSLRNRGFHTTPVCGVFGATVASGLLMGLTEDQMVNALGLAGAQSGGLMEMYGESSQKRFNPGPAASNGTVSAEMAKLGYTGTDQIFEGKRGILKAFSDQSDAAQLTQDLGKNFPVFIEFKPYACARPIHNAIDCVLEIQKKHSVSPKEIQKITVYRHPDWAHYHVIYDPKSINEAQVSLPYSVAVAFNTGEAFLDQYEDSCLHNPENKKLMDRVKVEPDAKLPRGVSCLMVVETVKGETYRSQVDYPKGSKQNPMNDKEMIGKFTKLSRPVIDPKEISPIVDTALSLEKVNNMKDLTRHFQKGD